MLAADKLQLQSALKQQATALKEKEFNLHHSNLMTVGTQAAVLAGLDITMFIEFQPPPTDTWDEGLHQNIARLLKFLYYIMIVSAFCSNMMVVAHTTALSVLGAGMALRGPDGSMMTATDGLYEERLSVFSVFGLGLACTVGSVVLCVWLILHWEAALVCSLVTMYTCRKIYTNYKRVIKRFEFDESETVDFHDIFNGPAAIRVMAPREGESHKFRMYGGRKQKQPPFKKHTPKRTKSHDEETNAMLLDAWDSSEESSPSGGKNDSPVLRRQSSLILQQQQHQQQHQHQPHQYLNGSGEVPIQTV